MAKVVKAFSGCPDGEIYPREFKPGDEVTGGLAAAAVREGWAVEANASPAELPKSEAKKTKTGK